MIKHNQGTLWDDGELLTFKPMQGINLGLRLGSNAPLFSAPLSPFERNYKYNTNNRTTKRICFFLCCQYIKMKFQIVMECSSWVQSRDLDEYPAREVNVNKWFMFMIITDIDSYVRGQDHWTVAAGVDVLFINSLIYLRGNRQCWHHITRMQRMH